MADLDSSSGADLWNMHNKSVKSMARAVGSLSTNRNGNPDNENDPDACLTPGTKALAKLFNLMGANAIPKDLMYLFRDVKSFFLIKGKDENGKLESVRPIGARSIFSRLFGRGVAYSLLSALREWCGKNNFVLDHVGVEKMIKATVGILEFHKGWLAILPDIINAFNEMERAEMIKIFMKMPARENAVGYLKNCICRVSSIGQNF